MLTDLRQDLVYEPAPPSSTRRDMTMIVRTAAAVAVAEEARRIAAALNPSLPLTLLMSMDENVGRARREWDSLARLLGILAGLAAVLSAVGLYGIVAHSVAARQREFGIRAALGASPGDVWRLVLRQSATIVGGGIALGLIGAYAFAQVLAARLVGVTPLDPVLWSSAAAVLIASAVLASVKPAVTASRVNLNDTLRAL